MDGGKLRRFGIKKGKKVIEAINGTEHQFKIFETKSLYSRV